MRGDRIKKIILSNFKGFYGEVEIRINGKNLVIFGENGSGKTCIVEALKLLFDSSREFINLKIYKGINKEEFENDNRLTVDMKNIISKELFHEITGNEIVLIDNITEKLDKLEMDGKISTDKRKYFEYKYIEKNPYTNIFNNSPALIKIQLLNGDIITIKKPDEYSTSEKRYLEKLSRSVAILSYREIMKIYNLKTEEDFYDLFLRKVMAGYLIPPRGEKTIEELIDKIDSLKEYLDRYIGDKRASEYKRVKSKYEELKKQLLNEANNIFTELKPLWNKYIHRLIGDKSLEIDCEVKDIGKLNFKVKWHGRTINDFSLILNEGKLNSISLALFLSYYRKYNPFRYKLLLLDDVVIGLDMNLRMPVIDLLLDEFSDYQIIITTYDEYWYNLMKMKLEGRGWTFLKLIVKRTDNRDVPFYIAVELSNYIQKAKNHLNNGDIVAASVYTRLEFERILKKYAKNKNKPIPYNSNKINDFWKEIKKDINDDQLKSDIELYRTILLNPAVHFDPKPKFRNEVENAIKVVERLNELLNLQ